MIDEEPEYPKFECIIAIFVSIIGIAIIAWRFK